MGRQSKVVKAAKFRGRLSSTREVAGGRFLGLAGTCA